jgi:hypothetical protein
MRHTPVVAILLTLLALGAATTAQSAEQGATDRTYACDVDNFYQMLLGGSVTKSGSGASMWMGRTVPLLDYGPGVQSVVQWPAQGCEQTTTVVPFRATGLRRIAVGTSAGHTGRSLACTVPAKVVFRVRFSTAGTSVGASTLTVWNAKKRKPIALLQLTPPHPKIFASVACQPQ